MGFEVGKKCISKLTTPIYKKGDVRQINSVRKSICNCDTLLLDLGYKYGVTSTHLVCVKCGAKVPDVSNILWVYSKHWEPLNEISEELSNTTVNDILKPETQPC